VRKRIEFPLFELMIVIILLFILAFVGLPKFMDVGSEARIKALNAIALNLSSVNRLLYSRAVIKNVQQNALQSTDILGGEDVGAYLVYGELRARQDDLKQYIGNNLIDYELEKKENNIRVYFINYKNERCYIDYSQAHQVTSADGEKLIKKARSRIKSTGC
jgi:Tfp pilus assembly protein FimT